METLSLSAVASASASLPTVAMVTDDASGKHSASSELDGTENMELDPNAAEYTPASAASAVSTSESTLAVTMAELIRAQTEALAAQTQAAAAQHLPPLKTFTGEGKLTDTDSFERWLESFEERAKLVGWNEAQQLHQLKLLLDRTALRAFQMFPEEDRHNLERTKEALKSRFKSTEIEELHGMEFHHKMQTTESVEELGLELQTLANKAFPSTPAKDFNRMLKGRFFQALLVRWQRKLGAPKPTESFKELYDRARIMEQHEKQYAAAAAARGETKHLHHGGRYKPSNNSTGDYYPKNVGTTEEDKENHGKNTTRERICYTCKQTGHISRYCPQQGRHQEAAGRNQSITSRNQRTSGLSYTDFSTSVRGQGSATTSRNAAVHSTLVALEDLSEHQLEELLAKRRLQNEQTLLTDSFGHMNVISASENSHSKAVGATVCLPITIEGVAVEALVDTGSQSTVISRSMLHKIARHVRSKGEPLPILEKPTVRLFGKDGAGGGRELVITAQLQANIEADGESTCVTIFVQPNSDQKCLLGMNVLPNLGLSITRANGESVIGRESPNPIVAHVRLVQSSAIPSLKGQFLKVQAMSTLPESCIV